MATFSLTCPRTLTGEPGRIPQSTFTAISGATRTRRFGTVAVGATLRAGFVTDEAGANSVLDDWEDTNSGIDPIDLPAGLFTNHSYLARLLPAGNAWHMTSKPRLSPIVAGRCEVEVEFDSRFQA